MNRFRSDFRYCSPAVRCSTIDGGIANLSEADVHLDDRLAVGTHNRFNKNVLTRGKRAYGAS